MKGEANFVLLHEGTKVNAFGSDGLCEVSQEERPPGATSSVRKVSSGQKNVGENCSVGKRDVAWSL